MSKKQEEFERRMDKSADWIFVTREIRNRFVECKRLGLVEAEPHLTKKILGCWYEKEGSWRSLDKRDLKFYHSIDAVISELTYQLIIGIQEHMKDAGFKPQYIPNREQAISILKLQEA